MPTDPDLADELQVKNQRPSFFSFLLLWLKKLENKFHCTFSLSSLHKLPCTQKKSQFQLQADYSPESHLKDHEVYTSTSRSKRKRARAVLDFERRDDDELGFRKNDIITIISQKDDHCWVGELNGHQGWFPAKLVEVLDERSKEYSFAGDDSVTQAVTDIVRGVLCPSVKKIFEHGLRR